MSGRFCINPPPPTYEVGALEECGRCGVETFAGELCSSCEEAEAVEYADSVSADDLESVEPYEPRNYVT